MSSVSSCSVSPKLFEWLQWLSIAPVGVTQLQVLLAGISEGHLWVWGKSCAVLSSRKSSDMQPGCRQLSKSSALLAHTIMLFLKIYRGIENTGTILSARSIFSISLLKLIWYCKWRFIYRLLQVRRLEAYFWQLVYPPGTKRLISICSLVYIVDSFFRSRMQGCAGIVQFRCPSRTRTEIWKTQTYTLCIHTLYTYIIYNTLDLYITATILYQVVWLWRTSWIL